MIIRHLSFDPGTRNFAFCLFEGTRPVKMGYLPISNIFDIKDPRIVLAFQRTARILVSRADVIFIERYVGRMAARGISVEKVTSMIYAIILEANDLHKKCFPITASAWKRKFSKRKSDYKELLAYAFGLGFMKKDSHFVDCLLMVSAMTESDAKKILKQGVKLYGRRSRVKNN